MKRCYLTAEEMQALDAAARRARAAEISRLLAAGMSGLGSLFARVVPARRAKVARHA